MVAPRNTVASGTPGPSATSLRVSVSGSAAAWPHTMWSPGPSSPGKLKLAAATRGPRRVMRNAAVRGSCERGGPGRLVLVARRRRGEGHQRAEVAHGLQPEHRLGKRIDLPGGEAALGVVAELGDQL